MKKHILSLIILACSVLSHAQIRQMEMDELPVKPTADSSVYIFYIQDFDGIPERNATVRLYDKTHGNKLFKEGENDIDGIFVTRVPLNINMRIEVDAVDTTFAFDNQKSEAQPSLLDFDLKIKLITHDYKRTYELDVLFDSGDHQLDFNDMAALGALLEKMQGNPKMRVEIAAHTDNVGKDDANMRLSQRRAQSVTDHLIEQGIEPSRIVAKGYGEYKPIAPNETPEGRQQNRRVEVRVIEE